MPSVPNRIAVIFDCDDTLAQDTTSWIITQCGGSAVKVFEEAAALVREGWDPPLAYLDIMMRETRRGGRLSSMTKARILELAASANEIFYPGTSDLFLRLREYICSQTRYKEVGVQVHFYIISGGIEEFLKATPVGSTADQVWASSFDYDDNGRPVRIKNVISFSEKTRYLFCINKGVAAQARSSPYIVNSPEPRREARAVPFQNMVYIGDGPSDIPCMSVLNQYGGTVIGILCDRVEKVWEVGFGRRSNFTIPPDYTESSIGYRSLRKAVEAIAEHIRMDWKHGIPPIAGY